ncbi:hypothetical protein JCM5350_006160 [Sporobolomyces pararoseus]
MASVSSQPDANAESPLLREDEPTPRLPSAQPDVSDSEDQQDDDESSLTSLSDLEERPINQQSNGERPQSAGGLKAGVEENATVRLARRKQQKYLRGDKAKKKQKTKDEDPKPQFFRAKHRLEVSVVQAAVESLPTGEQQAMISLMLNRYSSFCVAVDIPLFPLSPVKIALFLSQTLAVDFRSSCIRAIKLGLPTIDPNDSSLSREEGQRLTQELAEAWIQALGFAQLSTKEIWEKVHPGSEALEPIAEHPAIREIVGSIPSIQTWQEWQARGESSEGPAAVVTPAQTNASPATRWTKQGKAVAGPNRS